MAGTYEMGLADLFEESNMKMQSSTIYKALRGEGMRVRPLARTRSAIGKTQTSPAKSKSRPGSYKPEKGRVAAIKNMFELKATSPRNDLPNKPSEEALVSSKTQKSQNQSGRLNSPVKKLSAFRRKELTLVSESSKQRVPFRSTKLERPVSRASLKEESENKPKTLRRTIDTRALQKKSVPLFEGLTKGKGGAVNEEKSANVGQTRFGNKKRVLKRKRLGVTRRATVVAGKPVTIRNEPCPVPCKEESKNVEAGSKAQQMVGAAVLTLKTRPKLKVTPAPLMEELSRVPSIPKTPALKKTKPNSIVREVVPKSTVASPAPLQPVRKQLWLPTEMRDSYNQFCPDTNSKINALRRKRPQLRKKTNNEEETYGRKRRGGTIQTSAKSKFDNTTEEESSETDEEEASLVEEMRIRKELKKKSLEFFNQFRYGEVLRKSLPEIRYTSEILAKSEAEVKRRMTEMEIRMRLSCLDESVSKINGLVPKWTSMILATKDVGKIENIQKTLMNAEKILHGKEEKARKMLEKYLTLINNDGHSPPTEEMEDIEMHSGLVQLEMDSLERVFESYERQLQQELEEPTSISL